jgi:hypothetical protein
MMASTFEDIIECTIHEQYFNPENLKSQLEKKSWIKLNPDFQSNFKKKIDNREITLEEWEEITGFEFEKDDDLYDYLTQIYLYVYEDAPLENIYESLRRAELM